ncbi:MAG: hypothetical protein ACI89D_000015 [Bermanella sp.]|jgi:hypothetical protein
MKETFEATNFVDMELATLGARIATQQPMVDVARHDYH